MGFSDKIGKYQLSRTIGEGSFAKVKLAINTTTGQYVAIKIIDKQMVLKNNLMQQVILPAYQLHLSIFSLQFLSFLYFAFLFYL